jgi:hypothetical protein
MSPTTIYIRNLIQNRGLYLTAIILSALSVGLLFKPSGNQFLYLAHAYGDIYPSLKNDWFINTPDSNILFTQLTEINFGISRILGIPNSYLLIAAEAFLFNVLGINYLIAILRTLSPRKIFSEFELITCLTLGFLFYFVDIRNGVAGQYFIQPYLQPSSFGVFLLMGVFYLLKASELNQRKPIECTKAYICISISIAFHPSLFLSCAIGLLAFETVQIYYLKKKARNSLLSLFVLSANFVLALVLNRDLRHFLFPNQELRKAIAYFVQIRIPYHTIPQVWLDPSEVIRYVTCLVAAFVVIKSWQKKAQGYFLVLVNLMILCLTLVSFSDNFNGVRLAMPWRLSTILYPVSFLILLAEIGKIILKSSTFLKLVLFLSILNILCTLTNMTIFGFIYSGLILLNRNAKRYSKGFLFLILCSLTLIGFERVSNAYSRETNSVVQEPILREVSGMGLIPPNIDNIRIDYYLPIYINNQAVPNTSTAIVQWSKRVEQTEKIYMNFDSICSSRILSKVDWIMLPKSIKVPRCLGEARRLEGLKYLILEPDPIQSSLN